MISVRSVAYLTKRKSDKAVPDSPAPAPESAGEAHYSAVIALLRAVTRCADDGDGQDALLFSQALLTLGQCEITESEDDE